LTVTSKPKEDFSFRKSVGVCLGQAPHIDPTLFIGRGAEIDKMKEILKPGIRSQEQRRLVLGGMGGIGKTQLAISYAKHHRHDYESVFWLNATSEATLKDSFRTGAEAVFDVQDTGVLEGEQILIHIRGWLSDKNNSLWLLIFDNYDNPEQFEIEKYYPPASHGAIIVTTRLPHLVTGRTIRIRPLQKIEDSLEILQTRSQRENVTSGMPSASTIVVY
jgi:GTPase SAR1 family protein